MDICDQIGIVKIIYLLKQILNVVITIIPLILTILIMIDIFKVIIDDPEKISKAVEKSIKRFISAILIFFVPTIVFTIFKIVSNNAVNVNILCVKSATKENIQKMEISKKAEISKIRDEEKKQAEEIAKIQEQNSTQYEENIGSGSSSIVGSGTTPSKYSAENPPVVGPNAALTTFVHDEQRGLETGDCMSWDDNCYCPSSGKLKGFKFIVTSSTGTSMQIQGGPKLVSVSSCGKSVYVNAEYASNFTQAFNSMCSLSAPDNSVTVKSPITKIITNATTKTKKTTTKKISMNDNSIILAANNNKKIEIGHYATISRKLFSDRSMCSLHAYGVAIDINNLYSVTVNGKTYKPYANQGYNYLSVYNNLVAAIGSENDYRNPNYILAQRAFKPAGFSWGGDWRNGSFDPMHFEIR